MAIKDKIRISDKKKRIQTEKTWRGGMVVICVYIGLWPYKFDKFESTFANQE